MAAPASPPNNTVYIKNIEERIKIPDLKETLTEMFSDYGQIIDIVAKTNLKAKGQAFVVFDTPESAATAIEELQGFDIFGKPMELAFAKSKSDATVKAEGTEDDFETHKRRRLAEKERKQALEAQQNAQQGAKRAAGAAQDGAKPAKAAKGPGGLKSTSGAAGSVVPDEYLPPNKILFVQNLPDDYEIESVTAIFGRFEGFKEVRLVPGRKGLAFVEYAAETGAISAKESTAGMALGDEQKPIKVTYQRQ